MSEISKQHNRYTLIVVILYGVIMLFGLDRTPFVWLDEATLNSPAYELAVHGQLRSGVFADNPLFKESYYWQPPGQPLLTSVSYKIFGFGIWQTRVPQILCSMVMLCVFIALLNRIVGSSVAILSALCFCCDPLFVYTARSGRMDAQCVLFIVCALWFCFRLIEEGQGKRIWYAIACGLCIGIAGLTHPIAVAYGLGLGCVVLITQYRKPINVVAFSFSAAVPVGIWIACMLMASDSAVFREQFLKHGSDHIVQLSLLGKLIAELKRYLRDYSYAPYIPFVFVVITIMSVVVLRKSWKSYSNPNSHISILVIGFLFLVTFGFNAVMMTKEVGFYAVYPAIMLYALMGIVAAYFVSQHHRLVLSILVSVLVLNIISGIGVRTVLALGQWEERSYQPLESAYRKYIPEGAVVFGSPELWYAAVRNNNKFSVRDYFSSLAYPKYAVPNPTLHEYVVLRTDEESIIDTLRYTCIAEHKQLLPGLLEYIPSRESPYSFRVWKRK
jgi:4-amino-4-deoxy-L-arabinose transferase-like glycosyltransferase